MRRKDVNKRKKPFYKKWWVWVLAIIIVSMLGNAIGGGGGRKDDNKSASQNASSSVSKNVKSSSNKPASSQSSSSTESSSSKSSSSSVPAEYKSALIKAKIYATTMKMSKKGVYDQLTSDAGEKFSAQAGQYAIDHLTGIDWNANALAKAKSYQKEMSMSPEAIRDQLTSASGEQFTPQEASYAIQHLNDK